MNETTIPSEEYAQKVTSTEKDGSGKGSVFESLLKQGISHGFSEGYGNMSFFNSNDPEKVKEAQRQQKEFLAQMGVTAPDKAVIMRTLSGGIVDLDDKDKKVIEEETGNYVEANAIITTSETAIVLKPADCFGVLIYAKSKDGRNVVGIVHAGRAQLTSKLVQRTIEHIKSKYGAEANNFTIAVTPGLGQEQHVLHKKFLDKQEPATVTYWRQYQKEGDRDDIHLNMLGMLEAQLDEAGIPRGNIQIDRRDTYKLAEQGRIQSQRQANDAARARGEEPKRSDRYAVVIQNTKRPSNEAVTSWTDIENKFEVALPGRLAIEETRIKRKAQDELEWAGPQKIYPTRDEAREAEGRGELLAVPRTGEGYRLIALLRSGEHGEEPIEPNLLTPGTHQALQDIAALWRQLYGQPGQELAITSLYRDEELQKAMRLKGKSSRRTADAKMTGHTSGQVFDISMLSCYAPDKDGNICALPSHSEGKFAPQEASQILARVAGLKKVIEIFESAGLVHSILERDIVGDDLADVVAHIRVVADYSERVAEVEAAKQKCAQLKTELR